MALIGYARVSSLGQSLDTQLGRLEHCEKIFQEKNSGTTDKRSRLKACLEYVREGNMLVITRLDRLARATLIYAKLPKHSKIKALICKYLTKTSILPMQQDACSLICLAQQGSLKPKLELSGKWKEFIKPSNGACPLGGKKIIRSRCSAIERKKRAGSSYQRFDDRIQPILSQYLPLSWRQ